MENTKWGKPHPSNHMEGGFSLEEEEENIS